jgi:hypothetical protein
MGKLLRARVGARGFGATNRQDRWWVDPVAGAVALAVFVVYATWAAFVGTDYSFGPYLSPFYSPYLRPAWFPLSASLLVLWVPLGFRLSCYYYRKVYYRSYFLSPPACDVSEPTRTYTGETAFPLKYLPIVHRWFLYVSILVLLWLWVDALRAFDFDGRFGIGLGSLVMLANVVLLSAFTFGCHALRSAVGGNVRCFSCARGGAVRYGAWRGVTRLTMSHQLWAWLSLYSVGITDLYIRLCALGLIHDARLIS